MSEWVSEGVRVKCGLLFPDGWKMISSLIQGFLFIECVEVSADKPHPDHVHKTSSNHLPLPVNEQRGVTLFQLDWLIALIRPFFLQSRFLRRTMNPREYEEYTLHLDTKTSTFLPRQLVHLETKTSTSTTTKCHVLVLVYGYMARRYPTKCCTSSMLMALLS